ncbi:MAG: polyphosphate polymerase domain-containing protein [Butyricicoccus sp.]
MFETDSGPFRHELKYICSEAQLRMIEGRILHLMRRDRHAGPDGVYTIRSLYFDDYDNTCFYENESGVDNREKYRIRIYNHNPERIRLECKRKIRMKTQKQSCDLTVEQCRQLMRGIPLPPDPDYPPVLQKLLILMRTRYMQPKIITEYDRTPFVYPDGNVRVTFDRNIASSHAVDCFLEETIPRRPILRTGQHVLEVKYDAFLPKFLYHNLQISGLRQTAFSKYYLCRLYTL